jgi:membrane protein
MSVIDKTKVVGSLTNVLWGGDVARMPAWRAVTVRVLRVIHVVVRDLSEGQLSLRAMSLVYTTLLSLVPLLAISFSVLKGFGVHNQIQPLLLNLLAPLGEKGIEITGHVIEFVDNMKVGVLGAVGLGMLIYTVISLMQKIENSFNFVWRVTQERPFARRFGDYLSVLLIGPVLAFSSLGLTASLTSAPVLSDTLAPFAFLLATVGQIVPYLLIVAAFTFVYSFMPNTKVSLRAALAGALVAGLLWNVAGWVFASVVVGSSSYTAIYSAFATLILFMIWLYLSWLILLVGACVAYYVQHPEDVTLGRGQVRPGGATREALALLIALRVARDHVRGTAPTADDFAAEAQLPMSALGPVIAALETAGLLVCSADAPARYLPGRALDAIPLKAVLDAVRRADAVGASETRLAAQTQAVAALMTEIDRAQDAALRGRSLRDTVAKPSAAA